MRPKKLILVQCLYSSVILFMQTSSQTRYRSIPSPQRSPSSISLQSLLTSPPLLTSGNHYSVLLLYNCVISRMLYKWNHITCALLSLAFLSSHGGASKLLCVSVVHWCSLMGSVIYGPANGVQSGFWASLLAPGIVITFYFNTLIVTNRRGHNFHFPIGQQCGISFHVLICHPQIL